MAEPITMRQQLAAAKRELALRKTVYPRRVAHHDMSQAKADHEIAAMAAIVETLAQLVDAAHGSGQAQLFGGR